AGAVADAMRDLQLAGRQAVEAIVGLVAGREWLGRACPGNERLGREDKKEGAAAEAQKAVLLPGHAAFSAVRFFPLSVAPGLDRKAGEVAAVDLAGDGGVR